MDDLCAYAYETCRHSISLDTLPAWLEFAEAVSPPSASDGSSTPVVEQHPLPHGHTRAAVLGPYAQRLRDDVFHFLVAVLPGLVGFSAAGGASTPTAPSPDGVPAADAGRDTLLQVYARVPFDLFKAAIESPAFVFGTG